MSSTPTSSISSLSPWYSASRSLAPAIVSEIGKHSAWWDVFCGSAAITLAKPPCRMETINDLHGDVINLARVMRDPVLGPKLYRFLRRTPVSRAIHSEANKRFAERIKVPASADPDLDRACDYFVAAWMGRNGNQGTENTSGGFCVRYTGNGGPPTRRFESAVGSIPAFRRRLRNITILSDDGFALLERIEDARGTAIYCDPPYIVKGRRYVYDFDPPDHKRLAELLRRFKRARVLLSYYDHPIVRELYDGWTFRDLSRRKQLGNNSENSERAPEVLIINGPSLVTEDIFDVA